MKVIDFILAVLKKLVVILLLVFLVGFLALLAFCAWQGVISSFFS